MTDVDPLTIHALADDPVLKPGPTGTIDVVAALIQAMKLLPAVGKDSQHEGGRGEGGTGRWNYRSADAVVSAAGPAMAAAGVLCIPNVIGDTPFQMGNQDAIRIAMEYRFFAADGSSVTVRIIAHAVGRTAYTIGAAYSYAFKYALSQALAIPFDDPRLDLESTESGATMTDTEAWPTADEVEAVLALLRGLDDPGKEAFKAEAETRAKPGRYSWSFAGSHRWTSKELADAQAWIAARAELEPFDDAPPVTPEVAEMLAALTPIDPDADDATRAAAMEQAKIDLDAAAAKAKAARREPVG